VPAISSNILEHCARRFPLLERLILSTVSETGGTGRLQQYKKDAVQTFIDMPPPPSLSARDVRALKRNAREHIEWFCSMLNEDVETGNIYVDLTVARERFRVGAVSKILAARKLTEVEINT
jgi:hypothetical protein